MCVLLKKFSKSFVFLFPFFCCCLFFSAISYGQEDRLEQSEESGALNGKLIIEDIECRGNENTHCDFIKKKFYQHIGDILDPDEIADARLRLGVLVQFKDIKVYLEKGSQRGYVVVVFSVLEASHIQYNVGLIGAYSERRSFSQSLVYDSETGFAQPITGETIEYEDRYTVKGLFFGITDFNIFGTGKVLDVRLGNQDSVQKTVRITPSEDQSDSAFNSYQFKNRDYGAVISYYDPHLLSSQDYFMNVSLSQTVFDIGKIKSKYIEFGKRFARYSSVSLGASRWEGASTLYIFKYGWDSQDDTILPTRGSFFNATVVDDSIYSNRNTLLRYKKHTEIFANKILTFDGGASFSKDLNKPALGSSINFTDILMRDVVKGIYTGWNISIGTERNWDSFLDTYSHISTLSAGYTIQTDKWIARFNLSYAKER